MLRLSSQVASRAGHTQAQSALATALRPWLSSGLLRSAMRRCSTKAGAEAEAEAAAASRRVGPQRKDRRSHQEVLFGKGVALKGSLWKLPAREQLVICVVFSVTGSAAVLFIRPIIRNLVDQGFLGLPGDSSWKNGPWLFRFLYVSIMFPCYSVMLLLMGAIFGRRVWFAFMVHKMWSRMLPRAASEKLKVLLDIQHY